MNHAPRDDKYSMVERLDSYFFNHYVGLHSTVVSVEMAVAGLAAASLLGTSKIYHGDYVLLWLLWLASVLCCAPFTWESLAASSLYQLAFHRLSISLYRSFLE
jgi:hypothetical protein